VLRFARYGPIVAGGREPIAHQFGVGEHRDQQLVEVVRDPAGERAERLVVPRFGQLGHRARTSPLLRLEQPHDQHARERENRDEEREVVRRRTCVGQAGTWPGRCS
jgi:hypothetical protein